MYEHSRDVYYKIMKQVGNTSKAIKKFMLKQSYNYRMPHYCGRKINYDWSKYKRQAQL